MAPTIKMHQHFPFIIVNLLNPRRIPGFSERTKGKNYLCYTANPFESNSRKDHELPFLKIVLGLHSCAHLKDDSWPTGRLLTHPQKRFFYADVCEKDWIELINWFLLHSVKVQVRQLSRQTSITRKYMVSLVTQTIIVRSLKVTSSTRFNRKVKQVDANGFVT